MKKDVITLPPVSLAAMNVPSSKPLMVDKDIYLDVREKSNVPHYIHFDYSIPSMNGITVNAFSWHGETSQGSFSVFSRRHIPYDRRSCSFSWYTYVLPSPNQIGCFGVCCLGGLAKRSEPRKKTVRFLV